MASTLRRFANQGVRVYTRLDERLEISRGTCRWRHRKTSPRHWSNRNSPSTTNNRGGHNDGLAETSSATETTGFLSWYSSLLDSYRIITKCLTSGVIAASGDFLCQGILLTAQQETNEASDTRKRQALRWWDYERTLRFAFLGTFLVGPCIHVWYQKLASVIPGTEPLVVVQRVILDQLAFAPIFLTTFISTLWTLEGRDFDVYQLKDSWSVAIVANWLLWVPAQAINFRFVALKYQVLYSNVVAVMWNCFLSYSQASSSISTSSTDQDDF